MKLRERNELRKLLESLATAGVAALAGAAVQRWRERRVRQRARLRPPRYAPEIRPEFVRLPEDEEQAARTRMVIGSFRHMEDVLRAAEVLHREWPHGLEVYTPHLDERLFEILELPRSRSRFWVLGGAIIGNCGGWVTAIMLSIYWPHIVGNMPVIAVPPFTIISFELMILLGVFGGVFGLLFHAGLPSLSPPPEYLAPFKLDRFGVQLNCRGKEHVFRAEGLLRDLNAQELIRV